MNHFRPKVRRIGIATCFMTLALSLISISPALSQSRESLLDAIPGVREYSGMVIARPLEGIQELQPGAWEALESTLVVRERIPATRELVLDVPEGAGDADYARELERTGLFESVQPNWILYPVREPNDPLYSLQYHHHPEFLRSEDGWFRETGKPAVSVGICDTGIRVSHEDLLFHRLEGYNAVDLLWESNGGDISPVHPHGTQTTGCAAANGHNGRGLAGVGWSLSHRMLRVSNSSSGSAYLSTLTHAARTSAEAGDRVVSVSYTGVEYDTVRVTAEYIHSLGGLLVWAAGNANYEMWAWDRDDDELIVVGGTDQADQKWSDSNWGRYVDVMAPAAGVWTTDPTDDQSYIAAYGTSYAAPLVAGLLGLLWSMDPSLDPDTMQTILKGSCDDLGATGVDDLHGYGRINVGRAMHWFDATRLTASHAVSGDLVGASVAAGGDVRVLGAPGDDERGSAAGAAYVFQGSDTSWWQAAKLLSDRANPGDLLGSSVATNGTDFVFVGAPGSAGGSGVHTGTVLVYKLDQGIWTYFQLLIGSDSALDDQFGASVSASADRVLVGAPFHDGAGDDAGAAYVFTWDGLMWVEEQKLQPSLVDAGDHCGTAVAVDGDYLVVGSPTADPGGAAHVYRNSGAASDPWVEEARFQPVDSAVGDAFGSAVAVSWKVVLIGASGEDDLGNNTGSAHVYRRVGATWPEEQELHAGDAADLDYYGYSVSLSLEGSLAAIGSILSNESDSGTVYVHRWEVGSWNEQRRLFPSFGESLSFYGCSVALDDWDVAVGARLADSSERDTGAADLYDLAGLRLQIDPRTAAEGDTVTVKTAGTAEGSLAMFALTEVNGTSYFQFLLTGRANELGEWEFNASVPPGLGGVVAQFVSFAFDTDGTLGLTNEEVLSFD